MARKRMFDDKATFRTAEQWGTDAAAGLAQAERVFDPASNYTPTDDPSPKSGIAGLGDATKVTHATGVMWTSQTENPSAAVDKAYEDFQVIQAGTYAGYTTSFSSASASYTTALTGANNDLVYTANTPGVAGNAITITYTDPGGVSATLGVVTTGNNIVVNLGRASSAINSTATAVAAAIAGNSGANALVSVVNAAGNDGSGLVTALATQNLAGGLDLNNNLTFTAVEQGTNGNSITVAYVDPGGTSAVLGVSVTGSAITVNLGRASSAINTTATALAAAIAGYPAANALVTVANAPSNSGAGVVQALSAQNLSGGVNSGWVPRA